MLSVANAKHISAAGAMLMGCITFFLMLVQATKLTLIRETEQTKRDAALSVEAQVERERSVFRIEQERIKLEKFHSCIELIRNSKMDRLEIINPILIQMGCPQE